MKALRVEGEKFFKLKIQLPILWWKTDSKEYGLIIKDSSEKIHFFNKDGSYDGWSIKTNININ